jgi:hypothetical protein
MRPPCLRVDYNFLCVDIKNFVLYPKRSDFFIAVCFFSVDFANVYKQVYHTLSNMKRKTSLIGVFLICLCPFIIWHYFAYEETNYYPELFSLLILSLLAYFDMLTRRIPIQFLFLGLVIGSINGIFQQDFVRHILGGVSNGIISILIFLGGRAWVKRNQTKSESVTVFGWGDVYASATVGFLLGMPSCNIALLLTFILAVFGAGAQSLFTSEKFLKTRVALGPSFYLATALIFAIG